MRREFHVFNCRVNSFICLLLLPWIVLYLSSPKIKNTEGARNVAHKKLKELGPIKSNEWFMLFTFGLLLTLWIGGDAFNLDATTSALTGLALLLASGVLSWDDVIKESSAWETLIWLATLLTLSNHLAEFGLIQWFSEHVQSKVNQFHWGLALCFISLIYCYSHYFFASMTAHVTTMYSAFLVVSIGANIPPFLAAMTLAVLSSLSAGLTHYGTGSAPIYFGSNIQSIQKWWKVGGLVSFFNLLIWGTVGIVWLKFLNLF